MSYKFNSVTIRTDNSEIGMAKIKELWADIMQGKISLEFVENGKPVNGLFPISSYSDYENNENGKYNLSIMSITADFFAKMESLVEQGKYTKIDESGKTIAECADKAWSKVWELSLNGNLNVLLLLTTKAQCPPNIRKTAKHIAVCTLR